MISISDQKHDLVLFHDFCFLSSIKPRSYPFHMCLPWGSTLPPPAAVGETKNLLKAGQTSAARGGKLGADSGPPVDE